MPAHHPLHREERGNVLALIGIRWEHGLARRGSAAAIDVLALAWVEKASALRGP